MWVRYEPSHPTVICSREHPKLYLTCSNVINQYGIPLDPKTMKHQGYKPYIWVIITPKHEGCGFPWWIVNKNIWFPSKILLPKNSLILVYMGLRFFPLSFGGSCPNTRSISKRFIFLQGYLARGTFSRSTLTRNCYCLYHFLLANLSCHVFLQHFSPSLWAAFHILQPFCWMRNWNHQSMYVL